MTGILFLWQTFTLRGLQKYFSRSLFTIIGIALATTVVLAIQIATNSAKHHFDESLNLISGKANLIINSKTNQSLDENYLKQLSWLWDVDSKITVVSSKPVLFKPANSHTETVLTIFGLDLLADKAFRSFTPTQKNQQESKKIPSYRVFEKNHVLIGERFAKQNNLNLGSKLLITADDDQHTLIVAGLFQETGSAQAYGGQLLVMDIGSYQNTFNVLGKVDQIDLIVPPDKLNQIQSQLQQKLPNGWQVVRPQFKNQQINQLLNAYHANLSALSFIAFLVSLFLIYNTLSISVTRRRYEIGILKSLGVSQKQVLGLFLLEALTLSILGVLLGTLLGCVIAGWMVGSTSATIQGLYTGIPVTTVNYDPVLILSTAFVSTVLVMIASVPPVIEATAVPAIIATERETQELGLKRWVKYLPVLSVLIALLALGCLLIQPVGNIPIGGYLCSLLSVLALTAILPSLLQGLFWILNLFNNRLPLPAQYGLKLLQATLGKTSITVASLMVGLSLMISMAIMIESFRESVQGWVDQTLKADVWIQPKSRSVTRFYGALGNNVSHWLKQQAGVLAVDDFIEKRITYQNQPTYLGAGSSSVIANYGGIRLTDNRDAKPVLKTLQNQMAVIVSESFANRYKVKTNSVITLDTPYNKKTQLKVLGVYWDYSSENGYLIMDRGLFEKLYQSHEISSVAVYTKSQKEAKALQAKLYQQFGNKQLVVQTNQELRDHVMTIFNATFSITYALHGISIIIAILTIANTLFALVLTAKRDLTLLKTLGYSMQQVQQTILAQAAFIGVAGSLFGILSGVILAVILILVIQFQSFGWQIPIHWPIGFFIQTFLVTVLSSLVAAYFPAKFAKNLLKHEVIRNE